MKYAGYSLVVHDDAPTSVRYEQRGTQTLKVHFWAFRVPSKRAFVVRHFAEATDEDRAEAMDLASRLHTGTFEEWENMGAAIRRRNKRTGRYYVRVGAGHLIDDPLIQLELEMMLELTKGNRLGA